jgi:hypothetical protein
MDAIKLIMPMIMNQPQVKTALESIFHQPADYVMNSVSKFLEDVNNGPGIQNTEAEKVALFNRYYQGGLAMGFLDWESEIAAAALAGYTPMDVCLSFRNNRGWKDTTVEKVETLADMVSPKFIEKGKECGLIPKDVETDSGLPKTDVTTSGGIPPWEHKDYQRDATGISKTTAS